MKKALLYTAAVCLSAFSLNAQTSSNTCLEASVATPITGTGSFSVSGINGSEIPSPICAQNGGGASNGEWYRFVPTESAFYEITTDLPQNNGKDTRVHIYDGSCGSLNCVGGDDDSGSGFLTIAGFEAVAGQTYYIAWDDKWDNSSFIFDIIIGIPPIEGPVSFTSVGVSNNGEDRAIVDMNNDTLDDLVSVSSNNININYQQPDGTFLSVDIGTTNANNTPSWSLAAGDIDGNGYNDLLYGGGSGVTFMMANDTGTAFTEISGGEYVFSQRSNFIDINNDGHLDAFVCHDVAPNVYYINDGFGNLTFYQGQSSVLPNGLGTHSNGGNYGTVWIDFDNDKDMDMFIAKCRGGDVSHKINELWRNDGNGVFVNIADLDDEEEYDLTLNPPKETGYYNYYYPGEGHNNSSNLGDRVQTWSSAWADFDNDGDMDVYVGASSTSDGGHKLMSNNGNGTFSNITLGSGVNGAPYGIENAPADFDNDGYVDILTNGQILFNNGGDGTFSLVSDGMPPSGSIGDVNNDGFLDVFNGNVRYNNGNDNNWLKICTVGVQSNRNGIGARIQLNSPLGTQIRDVRSGEGFRYMSSLNTHFGIGTDTSINSVTVYWPSGTVDVIVDPDINSSIVVVEGETLSLEQSLVDDLILYPNPTIHLLNLNATYGFEDAIYSVYDMNGKRLMNSKFSSNTIDVSNLSTGNYVLKIINEGTIKSQKFIKQ
jgi:hypothetical protein